jgi:putative ABC transport system permease protein
MVTLRRPSGAAGAPVRLRGTLVAAQVAISVVLLAGSGLFLRSLVHALAIPTGFDPRGVVTASINPGLVRYDTPRVRSFQQDALERMRAVPGVTAAAWTNIMPINGLMVNVVEIEGYEFNEQRSPEFFVSHVTADYFAAAGTRILSGRAFTSADTAGTTPVAIVSQAAANRFWPNRSPIGAQMRPGGAREWRTIVGVVEDVTVERLGEDRASYVFYPFDQSSGGLRGSSDPAHLLVRTSRDPREMLSTVSTHLRSIDPQMPVYDVMPFSEHVRELVMPQQMGATLLAGFSLLALSLAAVGIYGVASYVAQLRTRELGIRVALGANAAAVRRTILRHGVTPALAGILLGLALAAWVSQFARAFLYDVSAADPLTFAAVGALLLAVAVAATWFPARRAAQLDPMSALRDS